MRILMIHNDYGATSGEEVQFDAIAGVLEGEGHELRFHRRSSAEIPRMPLGKMRAFLSGIHSPSSRREVRRIVADFRPAIAFVQNLYPLVSPSILPVLREAGVPVVMRVANYRLVCPTGLHLSGGEVCERCAGGREYWCALRNCEGDFLKSLGYAVRSAAARLLGYYRDNVSAYVCASRFLRDRLLGAGVPAERLFVIPNVVPDSAPRPSRSADRGGYVGYAGRVSREKGVDVLVAAAALCPGVPFRVAGRVSRGFALPEPLPDNVELTGFLAPGEVPAFLAGARVMVSPSVCFETFGMSVAEAMLAARPVVATRIGVFPEFVVEGETGLLAAPGSPGDLAGKIRLLWEDPGRCRTLGEAGRARALEEYSPGTYGRRLREVFAAVRKGEEE